MAKKTAATEPATESRQRYSTLKAFVDKEMADNRQWFVQNADCLAAGATRFYTGFLDLDLNMFGGFPYAKLGLVSGAESSGKSLLLMRLAARMLRTCRRCYTPIIDFVNFATGETKTTCKCGKNSPMNVLYVDCEDRLDPRWAVKNGLPMDKDDPLAEHFFIFKRDTGEVVSDTIRRMQQAHILDCAIIDSFATLFPEAREGRSAGEQMPGDSAKMIQNTLQSALHENLRDGLKTRQRCTILGSQQHRSAIGQYGHNAYIPGGWFLKHGLTTHLAMRMPKKDEGADKKKKTSESVHYVDFRGVLDKCSLGGYEKAESHWRVYTQTYGNYHPSDSDEAKRVLELLTALKMFTQVKGGYAMLGIPFPTIQEAMAAVQAYESFSLITRYVALYNRLDEDARCYLDISRFDYDPFYSLVIDNTLTGENKDGEKRTLTRFRLAPRESVAGDAGKPRGERTNKKVNETLAAINPPDTPASDS